MSARTLLQKLELERDVHFGRGTRDLAAEAIKELIGALLSWHAAFDWAPDEVHASPAMQAAKENGEKVLRRHGVALSTSSVQLKRHEMANQIGSDFVTEYHPHPLRQR